MDPPTSRRHPTTHPQPQGRANRLRWDPELGTRAALSTAFQQVLNYALETNTTENDAKRSVHEYRKSIRRLRALLKLVRDSMGDSTYRAVNGELRAAAQETSNLRDSRILLDTLDSLPDRARRLRASRTVRRHLTSEIAALEAEGRERETLESLSQRLSPLPRAFASAIPTGVTGKEIEAALRRSFAKIRRAERKALRRGDDASLHAWRKRIKELRYQLELLANFRDAGVRKLQKRLASLAESLGRVTDLIVLRIDLAKRRSALANTKLGPLRRRIRQEEARILAKVRETHGRTFRRNAEKAFHQQMVRILHPIE